MLYLFAIQVDIIKFQQATYGPDWNGDLSQGIHRATKVITVSGKKAAPTLTPNSKLWLSFADPPRWATGYEMMLWQGYPMGDVSEDVISQHSDAFFAELEGNAFPSTTLAILILAILWTLPWRDQDANPFDLFQACMARRK